MNNKPKYRLFLAVAFVALAFGLLRVSEAARRQTIFVSIPALHATSKERVVGFEIHITSGRIAALPNVPIGWNVSIDNNASWNTLIKASSTVGAAAVDPGFFREFLVVEKNESLGVPFDMGGEVVVTEDFATARRIKIGIKDFALRVMAP
jgi:hypothetical protein